MNASKIKRVISCMNVINLFGLMALFLSYCLKNEFDFDIQDTFVIDKCSSLKLRVFGFIVM